MALKGYDEYYERLSTLGDELNGDIRFPNSIMFTSTGAINDWVAKGHEDFFPAEVRLIMQRNLNGSFGCEYHRDESGKVVACVHRSDPYAWHSLFVGEMRKIYDQAIWDLRGVVWEVEMYQKDLEAFQPQFILLHDLSRHISHSKEILDVALDTVDSITHQYSLLDEHHPAPETRLRWQSRDIEQQLYFAMKSLRSTKLRCISLSERLQNEINLAFNIVAQRDNEVSIQMAKHSLTDNTMMKTVAIVSLVYLPGTFVSGIFGMNFFDFDGLSDKAGMSVSRHFWVYWIITIGLTLATIMIWLLWFNGKDIKRVLGKRKRRGQTNEG
ncbi:Magnesium transport protein CorA [Penicillium brevicompactum]